MNCYIIYTAIYFNIICVFTATISFNNTQNGTQKHDLNIWSIHPYQKNVELLHSDSFDNVRVKWKYMPLKLSR